MMGLSRASSIQVLKVLARLFKSMSLFQPISNACLVPKVGLISLRYLWALGKITLSFIMQSPKAVRFVDIAATHKASFVSFPLNPAVLRFT